MSQSELPPLEDPEDRRTLLRVARESIQHGFDHGSPLQVEPEQFSTRLREPRACFVTLRRSGQLCGCVGSLQATRPLVADVACNAFASAFRDSRFPPLTVEDCVDLEIHLSILTQPEALTCRSEAELISMLRPGIDGLILQDGPHRATFLPAVWESFTEPQRFVAELKRKAGLSPDHWSEGIHFQRYRTESIE